LSKQHRELRPKSRILHGAEEPIFKVLPDQVLANLRYPGSENAILWNLIYPLAQPRISLAALLSLPPLWGTVDLELEDEPLQPFFWGYSIQGERLGPLEEALQSVDGSGNQTEVDLYLVGEEHLILVEAKHLSGFGRCSRFGHKRCPEVQMIMGGEESCRYWEEGEQAFARLLSFGSRPEPAEEIPVCNRHYQLARTMLVGDALSRRMNVKLHLWAMISKKHWRSLEGDWLDFTERVHSDERWRHMRVLAWEDVRTLEVR
jgi:hypothetical protein